MRVLLAEDDRKTWAYVRRGLAEHGFIFRGCSTGSVRPAAESSAG